MSPRYFSHRIASSRLFRRSWAWRKCRQVFPGPLGRACSRRRGGYRPDDLSCKGRCSNGPATPQDDRGGLWVSILPPLWRTDVLSPESCRRSAGSAPANGPPAHTLANACNSPRPFRSRRWLRSVRRDGVRLADHPQTRHAHRPGLSERQSISASPSMLRLCADAIATSHELFLPLTVPRQTIGRDPRFQKPCRLQTGVAVRSDFLRVQQPALKARLLRTACQRISRLSRGCAIVQDPGLTPMRADAVAGLPDRTYPGPSAWRRSRVGPSRLFSVGRSSQMPFVPCQIRLTPRKALRHRKEC